MPWPRLRPQPLLVHLPFLQGMDLFITSSFGMDVPEPSAGKTHKKVCAGRDRGRGEQKEQTGGSGSLGGYI